jgi:hypothetical protein
MSNNLSEQDLRFEAQHLRERLTIVEDLLLDIEARKPDLTIEEITRLRQEKCKHLKGGKLRSGMPHKDYAVRLFTFIDGRKDIRCTICGKIWLPGYKDWSKALDMLESSTNSPAASEQVPSPDPTRILSPEERAKIGLGPHTEEEIAEANKNSNDEKDIIRGWVNKSGNLPESTDDTIIL